MQKKNITYYLLITLALLCILVGGAIYLVFRTRTLFMFKPLPIEWITTLDNIKNNITLPNNIFTSFLIYSLPTGLWTISYILLMQIICESMQKKQRFLWIYSLPVILLIVEFLQLFPICQGTFDIVDSLCYIIPIIVSLIIDKQNEKL